MDDALKKLGLSDHRAKFVEEKITANIGCYLWREDFLKLGLTDRNAIMSLSIECYALHKELLELTTCHT